MEIRGEVIITIELSQSSSEPFELIISLMDVTAECKLQQTVSSINYN